MSLVLVILAIEVLIVPRRVSFHLVWPFDKWLILNLLQNLMHQFSKHGIDCLSTSRYWLPREISPQPVVIVLVRPKIPPLLKDNFILSFPLLLVFLNPFVLIDSIHELAYASDEFSRQGLPWEATLESTDDNDIKVTIYLIIHLPVSVLVCFQDFPILHGQGQ